MKSIYSVAIIAAIAITSLASANAEMGNMESSYMFGSSMTTGSGMFGSGMKNRGQEIRNFVQQMNQQRKDMRDNRRNGSGATQTGLTADQLTCVRTAVAKRESAILASNTALFTATNSGLVARAAALNTVWTLTGASDRKMARQTAWNNWKVVVKSAQSADKTSRNAAWKTYRTDAQVCKVPEALTETEGGDMRMQQDWTNHD